MKLNEAAAKSAFLEFLRNINTKSRGSFWYRIYDGAIDDPDSVQIPPSNDLNDPNAKESRTKKETLQDLSGASLCDYSGLVLEKYNNIQKVLGLLRDRKGVLQVQKTAWINFAREVGTDVDFLCC